MNRSRSDLVDRFGSATTLPQLPAAALRLIHCLGDEDASGASIERIILGDPGLTAAMLRAASSAMFGGAGDRATTVRGAIARLGYRSIQAVAVSLAVQTLMSGTRSAPNFNRRRFAGHSIFVGFLGRYLFACRQNSKPFESAWNRDELFASGVLHDLGVGLLAQMEPDTYERVHQVASRRGCSIDRAFQDIYELPLGVLASNSAKAWGLPHIFTEVLTWRHCPLEHPSEAVSLSCLAYADYLAETNGHGLGDWDNKFEFDPGAAELVALPDDEEPGVVTLVARHTAAYVEGAQAA
ncbi:MAG: HDOD domain-containing protein [Fimbriimonas ginsengisoli]|uniref:HDOD domain-containing protein n=1 Tax=Fimbriimonas ginsengisoli TaxID=1005039 RepID=A0A931M071_FIMGI|nr:HDOD domain-containing protein [Fimbriimonas ginsengisoli]